MRNCPSTGSRTNGCGRDAQAPREAPTNLGQVYSRIWERGRSLRDVQIELYCINLIESSVFVDKKFFKKPATSATPATTKAKPESTDSYRWTA